MNKFLIAIPALLLCACSHQTARPVAAATPVVATETLLAAAPVNVELAGKGEAQVFACSDELACLKLVTGFCPNGYRGTKNLMAGSEKQVGILVKCITDEEIAQQKQEEAEEAAFRAARMAAMQAEAKAAAEAKKKTPAKK